jgi:hypothetical protein
MEEYPVTVESAKKHSYNFWKNKPVSKFSDIIHSSNIIETDINSRKNYSSQVPIKIPESFEWKDVNLSDINSLTQVCSFLTTYSVMSEKQKFKIEYTADLLKLALNNDTSSKILLIISKKTGSIFGMIGYTVDNMTVFSKHGDFGVCHFLCVHPSYRKKNVSNILIDEAVRRLVNSGISAGCFMTDRCVPTPSCCIRQYRRPLNYEKLHKLGFCALEKDCTSKDIKNFIVTGDVAENIVQMTETHITEVYKLLGEFLIRFNVCKNYSQSELTKMFIENDAVKSYVVLGKSGEVLDFLTFYDNAISSCNSEDSILSRQFYLYTCVNVTQDFILQNSLRIARQDNIDVLTTTDIMLISNSILTKEFDVDEDSDNDDRGKVYEYKFVRGGSKLYLNFFNWKCPKVRPIQLSAFWFNF